MHPHLNLITLVVADLARSRSFYIDGLGWTPAFESPGNILMVQVGEKLFFSIWAEHAAADEIGSVARGGTLPFTLGHNVSTEAEVDAVLTKAAGAGAVVRAPVKRAWGGYSGYFNDPDGFSWEVAFNPYPIGGVTIP